MPKEKTPKEEEEFITEEQEAKDMSKPTVIPRAVSVPDMFNVICDKLDFVMQELGEIKTLAKE